MKQSNSYPFRNNLPCHNRLTARRYFGESAASALITLSTRKTSVTSTIPITVCIAGPVGERAPPCSGRFDICRYRATNTGIEAY